MIKNNNENMIAALDRVMRLMRRRPKNGENLGRGVYRLLSLIEKNQGISTKQLADMLEIRPASLNERLFRLEESGIVVRSRAKMDQRVFVVHLLPKGVEHLERIREDRKDFNQAISQILDDEESVQLTALANKLSDGIEEMLQSEEMQKE